MRIVFSEIAEKHFKKLDGAVRKRIQKYLREVGELEDPRTRGKFLTENWTRIRAYRDEHKAKTGKTLTWDEVREALLI